MPPEVVAPESVSVAPALIVIVVLVGADNTINFLSQKVVALKTESVIELKVELSPNKIISPATNPWAEEKVIVTVVSLLVVVNAFVIAVPDGLTKGWMS